MGWWMGTKAVLRNSLVQFKTCHVNHYPFLSGFDDNGSGMASLLEMARALKQSQCRNSHTYILVALDLGETGTQGSTAFVQDFLIR